MPAPPNHALQRTEAGVYVLPAYHALLRQPLSLSLRSLGAAGSSLFRQPPPQSVCSPPFSPRRRLVLRAAACLPVVCARLSGSVPPHPLPLGSPRQAEQPLHSPGGAFPWPGTAACQRHALVCPSFLGHARLHPKAAAPNKALERTAVLVLRLWLAFPPAVAQLAHVRRSSSRLWSSRSRLFRFVL